MMTPQMTRRRNSRSLRTASVVLLALLVPSPAVRADDYKVIPLDISLAPGSEKRHERELKFPKSSQRMVVNVVRPTLIVVPPAADKANGSAVVICPGGGFAILSIDSEGLEVAKFLAAKGITCFVLKYRLMETKTNSPLVELFTRKDLKEAIANGFKNATPDGLAAVKHVHEHAQDYGVDPNRVGILGFSAGGMIAIAVAMRGEANSRPAFAASIYGAYDLEAAGDKVHPDAPPLFILAAQDDPLRLAPSCVAVYQAWAAAHKKAELHLYTKGGHGFGMNKQGLPTDTWADRYVDWLTLLNVMKK
jgi:acetyl esterase/lipase